MLDFLIGSKGNLNLVPVWQRAGAPSNGTTGTFAGVASPGDLLVDTTNKVLYINTNTQASPTWSSSAVGTSASVAITGGSIDGTPIGGSTPASGAFTTLSTTTAITDGDGMTLSGLLNLSVAAAVSAAGTTQGTATALTKTINNLTTVGASTGVSLPAAAAGMMVVIMNNGANTVKIYSAASETIDGGSGATGKSLTTANRIAVFFAVSTSAWISALLGAVTS